MKNFVFTLFLLAFFSVLTGVQAKSLEKEAEVSSQYLKNYSEKRGVVKMTGLFQASVLYQDKQDVGYYDEKTGKLKLEKSVNVGDLYEKEEFSLILLPALLALLLIFISAFLKNEKKQHSLMKLAILSIITSLFIILSSFSYNSVSLLFIGAPIILLIFGSQGPNKGKNNKYIAIVAAGFILLFILGMFLGI